MKKIFLKPVFVFLVIFTGMILWLSCADVPTTGPTLPDLTAEFRFLNAAYDAGPIEIVVDGNSIGSFDYKSSSAHQQYFAGSRVVTLSTHDTMRIAMATYRRGTVIILPKSGNVRGYLRLQERRTFDAAEIDTGVVRLTNATGLADDLELTIFNLDTSVSISQTLAAGTESGYLALPIGAYQISVLSAVDTSRTALAITSVNVTHKRKTSIVLGADTGSLAFVTLEDN